MCSGMVPKNDRISEKVLSPADFVILGGPAGRSALERCASRAIFVKIRGFAKMVENHEILDCLRENRVFRNFGGPAGGSALERASPPG